MADQKLTALTENTTPALTDIVYLVDDPAGTPASQKITLQTIADWLKSLTQTLTNKTLTSPKLNEAVALTSTATELNALDGQTGGWVTWTPTLANITLGNGSLTSTYVKIGKIVHFYFRFNMGSSSAMGSAPTFTLPVASRATHYVCIKGWIWDAGSAYYEVLALNDGSTTVCALYAVKADGTYTNTATTLSATVPMTWTTNDAVVVTGSYEAL